MKTSIAEKEGMTSDSTKANQLNKKYVSIPAAKEKYM